MASIYARGGVLWCRVKKPDGKWTSVSTECPVGHEAAARRFAAAAQREYDRQAAAADGSALAVKVEAWLAEREKLGIRSVAADRSRMKNHILPVLGERSVGSITKQDVRNLVRAWRKLGAMAPRSILNAHGVLHTFFEDAVDDGLATENPCDLKRRELPAKVDADPEWRTEATFSIPEVERLFSDPQIPVERRVQYALKALAGLRHGEVAGLRWRHYDAAIEPLGRLVIATSYDNGRTKTEVTRRVPVHATLAAILAAWKLSRWERVYGSRPGPDDLIVGTRRGTPVGANDAGRAMKQDLAELGLRVDAGEKRSRGGHDLRAWFITTCQEHGAHRDMLRVITHTSKADVMSGYTRAPWAALCAEVAKLRVAVRGAEVLELATGLLQSESRASKRWKSQRKRRSEIVTPMGIEPLFGGPSGHETTLTDGEVMAQANGGNVLRSPAVATLATALDELEAAILAGDQRAALAIVRRLRRGSAPPALRVTPAKEAG